MRYATTIILIVLLAIGITVLAMQSIAQMELPDEVYDCWGQDEGPFDPCWLTVTAVFANITPYVPTPPDDTPILPTTEAPGAGEQETCDPGDPSCCPDGFDCSQIITPDLEATKFVEPTWTPSPVPSSTLTPTQAGEPTKPTEKPPEPTWTPTFTPTPTFAPTPGENPGEPKTFRRLK